MPENILFIFAFHAGLGFIAAKVIFKEQDLKCVMNDMSFQFYLPDLIFLILQFNLLLLCAYSKNFKQDWELIFAFAVIIIWVWVIAVYKMSAYRITTFFARGVFFLFLAPITWGGLFLSSGPMLHKLIFGQIKSDNLSTILCVQAFCVIPPILLLFAASTLGKRIIRVDVN